VLGILPLKLKHYHDKFSAFNISATEDATFGVILDRTSFYAKQEDKILHGQHRDRGVVDFHVENVNINGYVRTSGSWNMATWISRMKLWHIWRSISQFHPFCFYFYLYSSSPKCRYETTKLRAFPNFVGEPWHHIDQKGHSLRYQTSFRLSHKPKSPIPTFEKLNQQVEIG